MRLTMRWYNVWHVAFNCLKRYRHKISPTINTTNHTINGIIYTESSFKMHSQYIWPLTTALTNVKQPNGAHVMFHRVWLRIIPTKKLRFTKKCTNIAVQQIWLAYLIELSSQADVFLFYLLNVLQSDETTVSSICSMTTRSVAVSRYLQLPHAVPTVPASHNKHIYQFALNGLWNTTLISDCICQEFRNAIQRANNKA